MIYDFDGTLSPGNMQEYDFIPAIGKSNNWATLDHDMQYKKEVEDAEEIMRELKECADIIHMTDEKMMRLRERIHRIE